MSDLKTIDEYLALIRQWADDRNLIKGSTDERQMLKLFEEFGETCGAHARGNADGVKDGIGDCIVVMTILSAMSGNEFFCIQHPLDFYADSVAKSLSLSQFHQASDRLAGLAREYGFTLVECIAAAWDEIKDRKGFMRDGIWIKEGE